jgi:hypothetical protein
LQGHGLSVDLANPIMFLRVVRATVSKGVKREYVRVVEAYRDRDGKTRHRTVINLGRKDLCWRSTSILASSAVCCMAMRPAMIASRTRISGRSERGTGGRCWQRAGCGAISASTRHSTNSRGPIAARRCG